MGWSASICSHTAIKSPTVHAHHITTTLTQNRNGQINEELFMLMLRQVLRSRMPCYAAMHSKQLPSGNDEQGQSAVLMASWQGLALFALFRYSPFKLNVVLLYEGFSPPSVLTNLPNHIRLVVSPHICVARTTCDLLVSTCLKQRKNCRADVHRARQSTAGSAWSTFGRCLPHARKSPQKPMDDRMAPMGLVLLRLQTTDSMSA